MLNRPRSVVVSAGVAFRCERDQISMAFEEPTFCLMDWVALLHPRTIFVNI